MKILAINSEGEYIARDDNGLMLSIHQKHITAQDGQWIELYIKNNSSLGEQLRKPKIE